jgi:hypothetical protein
MQDINSYIVDHGGYVVSTLTRARALAEMLQNVVTCLDSADLDAAPRVDIFGEARTPEKDRANVALTLELAAKVALSLAADLRAPQVDERTSDKIGYDADHSIIHK